MSAAHYNAYFYFATSQVLHTPCTKTRAVVVAQLVEWLLPIPEICSLILVIGNINYKTLYLNCVEKKEIKKKRPRMAFC